MIPVQSTVISSHTLIKMKESCIFNENSGRCIYFTLLATHWLIRVDPCISSKCQILIIGDGDCCLIDESAVKMIGGVDTGHGCFSIVNDLACKIRQSGGQFSTVEDSTKEITVTGHGHFSCGADDGCGRGDRTTNENIDRSHDVGNTRSA